MQSDAWRKRERDQIELKEACVVNTRQVNKEACATSHGQVKQAVEEVSNVPHISMRRVKVLRTYYTASFPNCDTGAWGEKVMKPLDFSLATVDAARRGDDREKERERESASGRRRF